MGRRPTTPRCPECGYSFDWDELRNQTKYHPYLFEHAERRRVRSFLKTMWFGLCPWKFWTDVRPTHEIFESRLGGYWLRVAILSALAFATPFLSFAVLLCRRYYVEGGSAVHVPGFSYRQDEAAWYLVTAGLLYVFWPWMTFTALMIFQITMRGARIRVPHVERCVVYSFDTLGLPALLIVLGTVVHGALAGESGMGLWSERPWGLLPDREDELLMVLACVAGLIAFGGVRLGVAYQRYLRFPHAGWVVLSTQVIVGLIAAFVLVWLEYMVLMAR